MDFGKLFSRSWKEYKNNFNVIFKGFFWFIILPTIILTAISIVTQLPFYEKLSETNFSNLNYLQINNSEFQEELINMSIIYMASIFIIAAIAAIFNLIFSLAIYFISLNSGKKKISFRESVKGGIKYFWKAIGLFLYILIICALILIPGLILIFVIAIGANTLQTLGTLLIILAFFVVVAEIILIIYLNISWIFSLFIIINEKKGIRESMKKSRYLIKGKWWRTFGYFILLSLVLNIVILVFTIPVQIINKLFLTEITSANIMISFAISSIFSTIASLFTTPFPIFFLKNFYLDLKK